MHFLLPPRQAQQLLDSCFVNTRGLPGHNIACDIHMEHLNRICKAAVEGLEANKLQTAIVRASEVMKRFDQEHAFQSQTNRRHESFPQIQDSLTANVKIETLKEWIIDHLPQSIMHGVAIFCTVHVCWM